MSGFQSESYSRGCFLRAVALRTLVVIAILNGMVGFGQTTPERAEPIAYDSVVIGGWVFDEAHCLSVAVCFESLSQP
ncbi:MAG: hypothetical protein ACOVQM_10590, partial [Pirellula sp.]